MRGTAHVFLEVAEEKTSLERLVVARQLDDSSFVLAGQDPRAVVDGQSLLVETDKMYNMTIYGDRSKSTLITTADVQIPISHIVAATFYARRVFKCGHHSRGCHTVAFAGNSAVATLLEDDDDLHRGPLLAPRLRLTDMTSALDQLESIALNMQCHECAAVRIS